VNTRHLEYMLSPLLLGTGLLRSIFKSALFSGVLLVPVLGMASTEEPSQRGIHVEILGIRNSMGAVACALFESPEGFPTEFMRFATNLMMVKVRATKATCTFEDISPGTYALAVIHDENRDGKLAVSWMGLPKEGYGFSNDAKVFGGAPSFEAASFPFNGQGLKMTITLQY
jgi:uncharacterized protein (DUF2141 family)